MLGVSKDILGFDGRTVDEVKTSFSAVVDEYLEDCEKESIEPKKPFSGQFITRLKPILHQKLFISAKKAGKIMNAFVEEVLEEKLST